MLLFGRQASPSSLLNMICTMWVGWGALILAGSVGAKPLTGSPGKSWSDGQLRPGESRQPMSKSSADKSLPGVKDLPKRSIPEAGQIHIGTHEFYRDATGVRKIDKLMKSYVQGVCVDFESETKADCDKRNGDGGWFQCPEDYPHADSKVKNNRAQIPLCFVDKGYAAIGKGPAGSWCVPGGLVGYGPEIAQEIAEGKGKVCRSRYRRMARKDMRVERKWKRRATATGDELEKVTAKELTYKERMVRSRRRKRQLAKELRGEKAKEARWKQIAQGYKLQVEDDRASAQVAVSQLQDALEDMSASGSGQKRRKQRGTRDGRTPDDPSSGNRNSCDMPWKRSFASSLCSGRPCSAGACEYVRKHCGRNSGTFEYLSLPYCSMGFSPTLGVAILIFWGCVLAVWMSTAAEFFLCPAVTVMSRLCALSEQVAGVTLLAFANGASDVAVVVAAAVGSSEGAAMAVGEVLGSAMVVSCLVLGLIAYNFPFSPTKDFSRDICFLLVANFWLAMTLLDSVISTLESLGFMVLYGIYLFVAITIKGGGGPSQAGDSGGQVRQQEGGGAGAASEDGGRIPGEGKDGKGKAWFPMLQMQQMRGWQPPVVESEGEGLGGGSAGDGKGLVGLLVYVNPINSEILRAGSMRDKLLLGLRAPAVVILRLTVPVVDETRERLAWNKDAFLCQLVLAPSVLLWGLLLHNLTSISPANAYLAYAVALVLGAMAAALVQVSTRSVGAPGYHRLTSVLGFLVAVAWIYILAVELVHVLQALGRVFGVSDSILGLTVLGSSQSLGDLVTNYSVARGGMPVMAAAACIAAPLLDTLFGVGLAGLLGNLLVRAPFPMQLSVQLYVTECFLIFALVSMLALIMMQGSKVTKMFGVVLLIIFVGYLVTIVILEFFFGGKPNLLSLPMID